MKNNGSKIPNESQYEHESKALVYNPVVSQDFTAKLFPQLLATSIASMTLFSFGAAVGWSSTAIPDIERSGLFPDLSLDEKSWIASLLMVGAVSSGLASGYVIDKFGRRIGMMIFSFLMALGFGLISTGFNIPVMCIGRFVTGVAMGGNAHLCTVYIAEISEEKIRGVLMGVATVALGFGILFVYVLGAFVSWFILSVTNIVFPVIVIISSIIWLPETPTHLFNKGKKKEAAEALIWLRGADNTSQIQAELDEIESNSLKPKGMESLESESLIEALMSRNSIKALGITLALVMCQQLSGIDTVIFFALTIFELAGTSIDPNLCSIIIGLVIMVAIFINMSLIDRAGRRVLMMVSELGMALSMFALATFFYMKKINGGEISSGWAPVPLVSLMSFVVMYNIGAGPIPFLMMGELLPPRIKGFGCAFTISFTWTMGFGITKSFEYLIELIEIHGCYYMFGSICLVGLAFTFFCVPETNGKTLDEIQKLYFSK